MQSITVSRDMGVMSERVRTRMGALENAAALAGESVADANIAEFDGVEAKKGPQRIAAQHRFACLASDGCLDAVCP